MDLGLGDRVVNVVAPVQISTENDGVPSIPGERAAEMAAEMAVDPVAAARDAG
jgi:hypothetical protein